MPTADSGRSDELQITAVIDTLPAGFDTLRAEALADGHGFVERLVADWISGENRFDRDGEALLAAFVKEELAGIGGLTLDPVVAGALRMRRFYVRPAFRRGGIGRGLASELPGRTLRRGGAITVNAAPGSVPFWESPGFRPDARDGHTHILNANSP
jgi:GNAT superfamily N-acetyltransferase